jgi:hypothetical protein
LLLWALTSHDLSGGADAASQCAGFIGPGRQILDGLSVDAGAQARVIGVAVASALLCWLDHRFSSSA